MFLSANVIEPAQMGTTKLLVSKKCVLVAIKISLKLKILRGVDIFFNSRNLEVPISNSPADVFQILGGNSEVSEFIIK